MRIRFFKCLALLIAAASSPAAASAGEHPNLFQALTLEADAGAGREGAAESWDLDGWVGGDFNKVWLKSEGEVIDGTGERAEAWGLLSRNIAEFWDLQGGIRWDFAPESIGYLAVGFVGLAPYEFETELHLFLSDESDVSLRLREEYDLLLTQDLVLQPYGELNFFAQDVDELNIGAGLAACEIGFQLRYEVTRKFAPYFDLRFERAMGETAGLLQADGERSEDLIIALGLRLRFS